MSRHHPVGLLAVALLAAAMGLPQLDAQGRAVEIEMKDGRGSVQGRLAKDDPLDVKGRKQSFHKAFAVKLDAGKYRFDAMSKDFDAYLRLEDPAGKQVASDDDGGSGSDARLYYDVPKAGTYRAVVTTFEGGGVGEFSLSVARFDPAKGNLLVLKDGRASADSVLKRDDPRHAGRNAPCHVYLVEFQANKTYRIDHKGTGFDAYLVLENPDGRAVAEDDDGGDGNDSRLEYRPTKPGTYRIVATTLDPDQVGAYSLSVRAVDAGPPPVPVKGGARLVLKANKAEALGVLAKGDPLDPVRKNPSQTFTLEMQANKLYRIDLVSRAFDPYLRLEDPDGKRLAEDDDGGDGTNSRITFRPTRAGAHRIVATSLAGMGAFSLSVVEVAVADGKPTPLLLKNGRGVVSAELAPDDPRDVVRNAPCRVYLVKFEANRTYQIDHASGAFDCYLRLEDSDGKQLAANDDGGDGTNSRLVHRVTVAGTYRVIATTLNAGNVGPFSLTVQESAPLRAVKANARLDLKDGKFLGEGTLTFDDALDKVMAQSRCQVFLIELKPGKTYRFDHKSRNFDAYLRLEDPEGRQLAADDDGGGNNDSRIVHHCERPGLFRIIATTLGGNQVGSFVLGVTESRPARIERLTFDGDRAVATSELGPDDARDPVRNAPCKMFVVELEAGQACRIEQTSSFGAFLRLEDPDGRQLAQADGARNVRIHHRAARAGTYQIVATSQGNASGAFTVAVTKLEIARPVALALKQGKAAATSTLSKDDPVDVSRPGNVPMKLYTVELEGGATYDFVLKSDTLEGVLRLEDADGRTIAMESGGRLSRTSLRCLRPGAYRLVVTAPRAVVVKGEYELSVTRSSRVEEVVLKDGQGKVEGKVTREDARDYGTPTPVPSVAYAVRLEAGETYHFDLSSVHFDAYLRLQGPDGDTVAEDDDGGDGLDAKVVYRARTTGTHYVVAKSAISPTKVGAFALTVARQK